MIEADFQVEWEQQMLLKLQEDILSVQTSVASESHYEKLQTF